MTVSYTNEVATSRIFGCFLKLLARWRGSIYKLVWADLLVYIIIHYVLNFIYRFALNDAGKWCFETAVQYCSKYISLIPLSFVLGFYVNIVMTRWWNQYTAIPYPDNLALRVSAAVKGDDEKCRMIRRTIVRYVCLCFTITLTLISPKIKRRFPTLDHLVDAGLLLNNEKELLQEMRDDFPTYPQFWVPLAWASNVTATARIEGQIQSDSSVSAILQEINSFRNGCSTLLCFDWISIPLVYTQVVTIAVYTYFLTSVIGRQCIDANEVVDLYFPILSILEFFFYMGWLRVAETLINPFGDDDDDFDVVWMIDRHIQVSYLIVDKIYDRHPTLMKDKYWLSLVPQELPYTVGSEQYRDDCPHSSTSGMRVSSLDAQIIPARSRAGTIDENDPFRQKSPSFLQRLLNSPGKSEEEVKSDFSLLTSVRTDSNTEKTPNRDMEAYPEAAVIDFDKLKNLRQLLLQQKVMKCMEFVKNYKLEEEKTEDNFRPSQGE